MKLYVGTYKKYNEGSLFGKWLDLDDYNDKDDLNQYEFYDKMYNNLYEGKIKNAEDVAQLSYKIRKENGEL